MRTFPKAECGLYTLYSADAGLLRAILHARKGCSWSMKTAKVGKKRKEKKPGGSSLMCLDKLASHKSKH